MPVNDSSILKTAIKRICTGPELSKDISFEEARDAMQFILDGDANEVQAALFLIGLRVKRETDDEFKGIQQALINASETITADVAEVVAISDPYNGFNRHCPASPFLPAVLAALGIATVSEGLKTVAPKFGVTHYGVLEAAGKNVRLTPREAAQRLSDPAIGWSYLDQSQFCPGLNALVKLRTLMVKRPVIATSERLIGPIRGQQKTHLVASFVHKAYPRIYQMLADFAGFDTTLLIKGVEGGITPSLRDLSKLICYTTSADGDSIRLNPDELDITSNDRAQPIPEHLKTAMQEGSPTAIDSIALVTASLGIAALDGEKGHTRDSIVYTGAAILNHLGIHRTMTKAADAVREVLDNGKAKAHFDAS